MHCNVRRVGAQVMRVIDYAHFALNKFESLSITLLYNTLPSIIFDHALHISLTNLNPAQIPLTITMHTLDCKIHW